MLPARAWADTGAVRLPVLALAALFLAAPASAEGPHAREVARHAGAPDAAWTTAAFPLPRAEAATQPKLAYRVYGYLPYWESIGADFRWDLISDLVVFAAALNTDGTVAAWHGWPNASLIATAHARGVRVHLAVTLFSGIGTLLNSAAARAQAIATLTQSVGQAGADGLDFDFEFVASADKDAFSAFLEAAKAALVLKAPGAELSIAAPPSVGYHGYDFARIAKSARLLVMNYDYHWSAAPSTGPVSPLAGASYWGEVVESDMSALLQIVPASAVVMGVPYYGYDWAASSANPKASTLAHGAAVLFKDAMPASARAGLLWDSASETPWYRYLASGTNHQVWFDDAQSIALKYQFVKSKKMAGAMIWALGYDSGRTELWKAIEDELGEPVLLPDAGTQDAGQPDAGIDAGPIDAGPADAGEPDAGAGDAGAADGGSLADAGSPDGGHPAPPGDAGLPQSFSAPGCASTSTQPGAVPAALALALIAALLARRRNYSQG